MKAVDIFHKESLCEAYISQANMLVESVCKNLNSEQRFIVENICKEMQPLIEVTLTPDRITQLFTNIETTAKATGLNRTTAGKVADVAATGIEKSREVALAVNNIIKKTDQWVQDTVPVQTFDQQFSALKTSIVKKFPELASKVEQIGQWAKVNPTKTAAVVGILTSIASLVAGPVGNAIANQVVTKFMSNRTTESTELTVDQIKRIIEWCDGTPSEVIMEGPLDAVKGAVAKGVEKLKQFGSNLTNKITADKLTKAWKAAGSPTDSNVIAELLRQAGVSDAVLKPVFKSMKIRLPAVKTNNVSGLAPVTQQSAVKTAHKQKTASTTVAAPVTARRIVRTIPVTTQPSSTVVTTGSSSEPPEDNVATATTSASQTLDYQTLKNLVSQMRKRDAVSLLKYIDSIDPPVSAQPTATPTATPTAQPKAKRVSKPKVQPASAQPTATPTATPTAQPKAKRTRKPKVPPAAV